MKQSIDRSPHDPRRCGRILRIPNDFSPAKAGPTFMTRNLSELLADPDWVHLDREEDLLMALTACELTDPGSTGCDRDFGDEIHQIAAQKAALEVSHA